MLKRIGLYTIAALMMLNMTACSDIERTKGNGNEQAIGNAITESQIRTKEEIDNTNKEIAESQGESTSANVTVITWDNVSENSVYPKYKEKPDTMFYYSTIPGYIMTTILGKSLQDTTLVSANSLRYLQMKYYDTKGETMVGELICNERIADDLLDIFYMLYNTGYRFENISLAESQKCDREKLFETNTTHCLNYTTEFDAFLPSKQAFGMGIYINPMYNPSITLEGGRVVCHPSNGVQYADREAYSKYKITEGDMLYDLFTSRGFKWGGNGVNKKELGLFYKD